MTASLPRAAAAVALAAAALAFARPAAARSPHDFDVTYRAFGPVRVDSDFRPAGDALVRFEGCYSKGGPEAVCGFTVRARRPLVVTNAANLSHATRAGGAAARTCCVFEQGRPEGFPIVTTPEVPAGVATLASKVEPGRDRGFLLRVPDYRAGAEVTSITFSRGGGDPGVTFPTRVRPLP